MFNWNDSTKHLQHFVYFVFAPCQIRLFLVVDLYFTFWNKKSLAFYLDFNLHSDVYAFNDA